MRGVVMLLAGLLLLQGCSSWEPWVKPYERSNSADPVMNTERDPASAEYEVHAFKTREAARGAAGGSGSGCGCN